MKNLAWSNDLPTTYVLPPRKSSTFTYRFWYQAIIFLWLKEMHLPQHRKSFMRNKTAVNQSIFIYSRIKKCKILKFNNNTVWIKADQIRDINVACCEEFQCRYTCFGLYLSSLPVCFKKKTGKFPPLERNIGFDFWIVYLVLWNVADTAYKFKSTPHFCKFLKREKDV